MASDIDTKDKQNTSITTKSRKTRQTVIGRKKNHVDKATLGGMLIAIGVVYGDLGTSPMYAAKSIMMGQGGVMSTRFQVLGSLSLVFWFMVLVVTVKYVMTAMRADNQGEGGTFALFSAVKDKWKHMATVAMIGGAAFLADSVFTPAVSITSAVEGLASIPQIASGSIWSQELTILTSVVIIVALFLVQHSGAGRLGKLFGPVMAVWFTFIAVIGVMYMSKDWTILESLNPIIGIQFLFSPANKAGVAIMGSVFLAMTGAEALYSDMGHVGRKNIWASWPLVNVALMCSYFGQGVWMLEDHELKAGSPSPFFLIMPEQIRSIGVVLALAAGVIASQALISGAFTLVAAADGLSWLPRLRMSYPGTTRGQIYIPAVNVLLCLSTISVVFYFKSSNAMEAAYGLALIVAMLMDSVLLFFFIKTVQHKRMLAYAMCSVFIVVELMFLVASMSKFIEGGYVTVCVWAVVFGMFWVCSHGSRLETMRRPRIESTELARMLKKTMANDKLDLIADNLIYLTPDSNMKGVEKDVAASMVRHRAHAYWVVSVIQAKGPYDCTWKVSSQGKCLHKIRLCLGYKIPQFYLQSYMREIMKNMLANGEIDEIRPDFPKLASKTEKAGIGSEKYVLMHRVVSPESQLPESDRNLLRTYQWLKSRISKPVEWFGLETSDPIIDTVSVWRGSEPKVKMTRITPAIKKRSSDGSVASIADAMSSSSSSESQSTGNTMKTLVTEDDFARDGRLASIVKKTKDSMMVVNKTASIVKSSSTDVYIGEKNGYDPDATGVMEPLRHE